MSAPAARPSEVIAGLERQLRDLWSEPARPGEVPKTRVCTMNLIVVAGSEELADRYLPIIDEVTRQTPARAILVALAPEGDATLEGDVSAVCSLEGGRDVCSERIRLVARGAMGARLASAVDPLRVPELPTALVWLGRVTEGDPAFADLARDAQRIILDTEYTSIASLVIATRWARSRTGEGAPHVADLAWTRLAPFQEMCARFFDEPRNLPLAEHVHKVELAQAAEAGAPLGAEGALLLGWLATRLGWRTSRVAGVVGLTRPDGGTVALELGAVARPGGVAPRALARVGLEAKNAGHALRGTIERDLASGVAGPESTVDTDVAVWRLEESGAVAIEQRVRLRANKGARLLERTLHRPAKDPALADAVEFAEGLLAEGLVCQ